MEHIDKYTCEETFRRLNDYLDRELTSEEMKLVKEHLEVCEICTAEYAFEAGVLNEVRANLRRIAAPSDLMAKVSRVLTQMQSKPPDES